METGEFMFSQCHGHSGYTVIRDKPRHQVYTLEKFLIVTVTSLMQNTATDIVFLYP